MKYCIKSTFEEADDHVTTIDRCLFYIKLYFSSYTIGREPNKIDIFSKIKGLTFEENIDFCEWFALENFKIPYIHINHFVRNKLATGRIKDLSDVEQLSKLFNIKF